MRTFWENEDIFIGPHIVTHFKWAVWGYNLILLLEFE